MLESMKVQRHLPPEQQALLREVVARQRPERLALLDERYTRPLRLEERGSLVTAIKCEIHQHGYRKDELLDLWHLRVCVGLRCMLTDDQRTLLRWVIEPTNAGMLTLIDQRDWSSWDEGQRKTIIQIIAETYSAKRNQGTVERKELNDTGRLLWGLWSHVYADTPLHPDDFALFRAVVERRNPPKASLLTILEKRPLNEEDRRGLYDAITAELQETGAKIGLYTNQLEGLINYVGSQPSIFV